MMSNQVVPQGYKQTKVWVVPDDWEVMKLNDIVKVSQGLQITISNRFKEPSPNRVFYITIPYINGKKVEYIENPNQSILCKKNDLLVVRTGSGVGNIITGVEGAFHNNFFKIKGLNNLNIKFIYYFLTLPRTKYLMKTYASNGTIPDLPHGDFYSLYCKLPPLEEQQKIANILTTWDDAISKQDALIRAKEELKKGLMKKLLSEEMRFDGFDEEWKKTKLSDIGKIITGTTPSTKIIEYYENGIYPWITPTDITNKKDIYSSKKLLTEEGLKKGRFIEKNTLLVTCIASIGKNAILKVNGSCNQQINAITPNNKYDVDFIYYLIEYRKNILISFAGQGGLMMLNKNDFSNIKFLFPPLQEQQKIAEVLTNADKEIDLLKNELQELKKQKKGLMQKLLTGEVRVNT